jgi:hypothetical protein
LTYPCWLLVHESSITYTREGRPELAAEIFFVTVTDGAGRRALPVFTGLDLARRFAGATDGLAEAVVAEADGREKLRELLELVGGDGVAESVVFDPADPFDRSRRAWRIGSVIQHLAEGEDSHGANSPAPGPVALKPSPPAS